MHRIFQLKERLAACTFIECCAELCVGHIGSTSQIIELLQEFGASDFVRLHLGLGTTPASGLSGGFEVGDMLGQKNEFGFTKKVTGSSIASVRRRSR